MIGIFFCLLIGCVMPDVVLATTFTVNSPSDVPDANPGDGICRTGPSNTVCTLRAAIMEANLHPGADTINLQANTTYLLTRVGLDDDGRNGDLDVLDSVTIVGAGPASTIIDGNGQATGERVMQIFQCIGNASSCDTDIVVNISGVKFQHGQSNATGGGIENAATLTIENCVFTENAVVNVGGGGIHNSGTLMLSNSTVANNTAGVSAGINVRGPTTIINSTVSGNVSLDAGGGLNMFDTTLTIIGSTFSGNQAEDGGAILAFDSTLNLINTTISGNSSTDDGGGLYVSGGTLGLYNTTIAANQANADGIDNEFGGGVYAVNGIVTLANSIITDNETVPNGGGSLHILDDCAGTLSSIASDNKNNIVSALAGHCTINGTGKFSTTNPSLGPLQNNGGPTKTHALQIGSAAIDAGDLNTGCRDDLGAIIATDQRGVHRPAGAFCDLGAFEYADIIFQDGFDP